MVVGGGSGREFCCFADCVMVRRLHELAKGSLRIRLTVGDLVLSFGVAMKDTEGGNVSDIQFDLKGQLRVNR
jgi:hypothetical protein